MIMQTAPVLTQPSDLSPGTSFYENELPVLLNKIKNDCGWKMGDLKSMVVINEPYRQIVLTALHSKTEIESHQTGEFVLFHILEGCLKISIGKETTTLVSGQKITLYDRTKYKLEALAETIFLLIISPLKAKNPT